MGFSRFYLNNSNFVFTKLTGNIEDDDLLQHVIALNKETAGIDDLRQLSDCCEIKSVDNLTVAGTTNCARQEIERPKSKLAIVVSDSQVVYGMVRAYTMFAEDHRGMIEIFKETDKALEWLADNPQEMSQFAEFINKSS